MGGKNLDIFGRLAIKKFPGRFPPQGFILVSMGIILLIMCSLNESIEPPLTLLSNVREVLSMFICIVSIIRKLDKTSRAFSKQDQANN